MLNKTSTLQSHFYLTIGGEETLSEDLARAIIEIRVENSLHLPDVATITLHDPQLYWLDQQLLALGQSIVVHARAQEEGAQSRKIFDGELVEIEPEFGSSTHYLVLRAFDRLHRLSRGTHSRTFQNTSDGDLVKQFAREAGLKTNAVSDGAVHQFLFQFNQSNLDFLRQYALANGNLLFVEDESVRFVPFNEVTQRGETVDLRWGESLLELRPRLTTVAQVNAVHAQGWDPQRHIVINAMAQAPRGMPKTNETEVAGDAAQRAFRIDAQLMVAMPPLRSEAAARSTAQSIADRSAANYLMAEGTAVGNPRIVAGSRVHIDNLGDRLSGTYLITSTTHIYASHTNYKTQFSISGQAESTLLALLQPTNNATVNLAYPVIGIVTDIADPDELGRVKVKFPWLSDKHSTDWARVVSVGGGPGRGFQFQPEVNDEVLVVFEGGDARYPYILGGLWNGQDAPPEKTRKTISGGKVTRRMIRSRTGHTILFDDSNEGGITIADRHANTLKLDSREDTLRIQVKGNVSIQAQKDVAVEAQGNIALTAHGDLNLEASQQVNIKGQMINLN